MKKNSNERTFVARKLREVRSLGGTNEDRINRLIGYLTPFEGKLYSLKWLGIKRFQLMAEVETAIEYLEDLNRRLYRKSWRHALQEVPF